MSIATLGFVLGVMLIRLGKMRQSSALDLTGRVVCFLCAGIFVLIAVAAWVG